MKKTIPLLLLILILSSCHSQSDRDLLNIVEEFDKIYKETIMNVDPNDFESTSINLSSEGNVKNLERMKLLIEKINSIESNELNQLKKNTTEKYNNLTYLIKAITNIDNLSFEERRRVFNILVNIESDKK